MRVRASAALVLCVLAAGGPARAVLGQNSSRAQAAPGAAAQPVPIETLAATVDDRSLAPAERERSAMELVGRSDSPAAREAIARLLRLAPEPAGDKPDPPPGAVLVLRAIARVPEAPPALLPLLRPLATNGDARLTLEAIGALGSVRTVESARLLGTIALESKAEPVRNAAFGALFRLTGRDDLGRSPQAWGAFFSEAASWSDDRWRDELARGIAARADRLAESRRAAATALTESLRKLHVATAPEDRSALLVSMLNDSVPEVRAVGFDLVARELSAARRLDPVVGDTVTALLRDPSPLVRENAAILIKQIAPPGMQAAVMGALGVESEPAVAAAMLQALSRNPTPELIAPTLTWLQSGTGAVPAATDSAWSLARAGLLYEEPVRARVLAVLRAMPVRNLTGPGCQLVASLGNDTDRQSLAVLLDSDSPALKLATAEALVLYPEFLDSILAAAATEPQLFETAARGVIMDRPSAAGFRAIAGLAAPSEDSRRRALLSIAAVMSAKELLEVAKSFRSDPPFQESLLTVLAAPERILSEGLDPEKRAAIGEGLILLAEARLALDRPDSAVTALDTLESLDPSLDGDRTAPLRAMAMLCLNRIEDADLLNAPASVWLDALARCIDRAHAPDIAERLEKRFEGALSSDEQERFEALKAKLPESPLADVDAEFVGPPAPRR